MSKYKFNTKKKSKINFFKSREDTVSKTAFSGEYIEFFSDKEVVIDGCKGVVDYADDYIKLRLNKKHIILSGSGFYIYSFENEIISIKGKISSLEFV